MRSASAALILVNDCRTPTAIIQIRNRTKGEKFMFKKIAIASAAAALFSIGQSATAGQTTNSMTVTATVNANCVVTTGPGAISGTYDPVTANAVSNLDFT